MNPDVIDPGFSLSHRIVPTGLADLDGLTGGGLRPGQLTVIAGHIGAGSSLLAHQLAFNCAATHGLAAGIVTLESGQSEIVRRFVSSRARVSLHHLTADKLSDADHERVLGIGNELTAPLHFASHTRDLGEINEWIEESDEHHDLRLLVVDGAHLITPEHDYGGRAQHAEDLARWLKGVAAFMQIAVVATVPLEMPNYGNRPTLNNLGKREAFAANADMVILVHREDLTERETPRAGEVDLIVAKHRNGPVATITAAFQAHYARIVDMKQA